MKRIFSHSFLIFLFSITTIAAHSETSGSISAASCNLSDVQSALNSVTTTTTLVTIPAGTCSWTGNLTWTVPAGSTNLTIQGQTAVNCTGTAGTSSFACTATDNTIIQDSFNSGGAQSPWIINLAGNSTIFRMTGLTIAGGTGNAKDNGILQINGPSNNLRLDHIHFNTGAYTPVISGVFAARLFGELEGVIDHSICDNGGPNVTSNCIGFSNNIGDSTQWGDDTWASPTSFGSGSFMYMENDVINGGMAQDCDTAGRFVVRYSSLNSGSYNSSAIHAHGTKSPGGRMRSCRAYEAYHNYIVGPTSSGNSFAAVGSSGGPSLVWGNTLASGYNNLAAISASRNDGSETETNAPAGWGYCGTSVNSNGVGSGWDGNNSSTTGYPCLDGLGRGQGQALNGQSFPNGLNSVTGKISWPEEMLEPIYYWGNILPSGVTEVLIRDQSSQLNRDVYEGNSSFNGTTGTGSGLSSGRPTTCTSGPSGTYGTSPTGSYGVAYFATDANGGNGELYVCTATNTWTGIYEPYTYPHPLESGSTSNTASIPPPPSNLSGTLIQ